VPAGGDRAGVGVLLRRRGGRSVRIRSGEEGL